jgi:LPS export ABC transporter protein LptC
MMARTHLKFPRKMKWLLLSIMLLTVGSVVSVFIGYRFVPDNAENMRVSITREGDISISRIHHTATRNGKTEWILEAESAHVVRSRNRAILKEVTVTFFLKDESRVRLSAHHGILDYKTNDIEVNGDVIVNRGRHRLRTDSLSYRHRQRRFVAKAPVTISGESMNLTADSMSYDLTKNRTLFEGNVRTILDEKFML